MAGESLSNARFDQLPISTFIEPEDILAFRSLVRGVTYGIKAKDLIPSTSSNFQWSPTTEYESDDVVTYGGSWWQSQQDDSTAHVPGTEGTTWWLEIPKGNAFDWWTAGVYTDAKTVVLSAHSGQNRWYRIKVGVTLPYNSVDIEDEEDAGDWIAFTEMVGNLTFDPTDATCELDCKFFSHCVFVGVGGQLEQNTVFSLARDSKATRISMTFYTGSGNLELTFPNSFQMSHPDWDSSTHTLTLPETPANRVVIEAIDFGGIFIITNYITNAE